MAPEMIEPLEPWADRKKKNVWAVAIDLSCHGEHGHLKEICTDYLDAKRKLTEYLTEEFDNSTLLQWQSDDRYATVSEKDSYECYEKGDYQNNHYHICLKEKAMVMEEMFIRETAQLYQQQLWREDILSRMMQCEACEGLSGWQYKRIEKESDMAERLEKQLGTNDSYWKAYWTSVEQVISKLVQKYTEDRPKCYDPETYNIYPLCSGNGGKQCSDCAFFVDLETGGV